MPDQFCPSCGTEVDADARFCPTCGHTLGGGADEMAEDVMIGGDTGAGEASPIPAAPAWPPSEAATEPEPEPEEASAAVPDQEGAVAPPEPEPAAEQPEPEDGDQDDEDAGPPPIPAWRQQAPGASAAPGEPPAPPAAPPPGTPPSRGPDDLPITLPTTLSGWLIGGGSGFAALALLPRLASVLNVLIFVALLWVAVTVFLADRLPRFEHQRLAVLVTVMVALGAGLDRAAFTVRGVDTVFLVMALIAAAGVLLVELDIDRPLPPSGGTS
jgi:hypothetical protein